ncbi:MAG: hypothetical protein EOO09_03160 [Chitinophagaceae bacterium]|nr:MAG: hypothetical protein EOO09_03160 [Chitinophagaceae bacterium]
MKKQQRLTRFQEISSALFILLFLYTGITKLEDTRFFAGAMAHSPLIGRYANFLSGFIPSMEIGICVLLFIPATRYLGLILSALLMAVFTWYIGYMMITSSLLPCTCGGIIQTLSWNQHLWFNSAFLLMGLISILFNKRSIATDRRSRTPAT